MGIGRGGIKPKLSNNWSSQMAWVQVEEATIYSTSTMKRVIVYYFLLIHEIIYPKNNKV